MYICSGFIQALLLQQEFQAWYWMEEPEVHQPVPCIYLTLPRGVISAWGISPEAFPWAHNKSIRSGLFWSAC